MTVPLPRLLHELGYVEGASSRTGVGDLGLAGEAVCDHERVAVRAAHRGE